MRKPSARSITSEPILPAPITPSVLPVISTPMKRFFSHLPACVEVSACGIWRASASIKVIACSAVVIELPKGVFITMMPLAVAAGMSTLSTPMPARPMTFRFFARSKIFGVTLVAERIASPSKLPISSASFSLSAPSFGWKSTSTPRSLKICTAAGESASEIRTRGATVEAPVIWSAQPAQHVRVRIEPGRDRLSRLNRHAVPMQHRNADVAPGCEVFDQVRTTALEAAVKHDGGVDLELASGRVGPCARRHLVTGIRRDWCRLACRRIEDCDVAGLVQDIARIGQPRFIDENCAAADIEPRQKRRCIERLGPNLNPDFADERREFFGQRISEHRSRRLAQRVLGLRERPVDPGRERRNIGALNRAATPDAQARWRIAMRRDVIGGALFLDQRDEILHEGPLRIDR